MTADALFRPEDSETEVKHLQHGELAVIETVWGHMAGGGANEDDTRWMNDKIASFLGTASGDLDLKTLSLE